MGNGVLTLPAQQDAHNLAWKLAAAFTGARAGPAALLASYGAERGPVARANSALSVSNWNEAVRVPAALGLDPRAAALLSSVAHAGACWGSLFCYVRGPGPTGNQPRKS